LTVIADATVLIGLHQIGHLFLLRALFEHIVIPPAVAEETERSVPRPDWLAIRAPRQIPSSFSKHIGMGEREAIALALETHPDAFIVDDYAARVLAERLGIPIIGTAGILRLAKDAELIPMSATHSTPSEHLDSIFLTRSTKRCCAHQAKFKSQWTIHKMV
jgi:predicted nucleic acid-binding protein